MFIKRKCLIDQFCHFFQVVSFDNLEDDELEGQKKNQGEHKYFINHFLIGLLIT